MSEPTDRPVSNRWRNWLEFESARRQAFKFSIDLSAIFAAISAGLMLMDWLALAKPGVWVAYTATGAISLAAAIAAVALRNAR